MHNISADHTAHCTIFPGSVLKPQQNRKSYKGNRARGEKLSGDRSKKNFQVTLRDIHKSHSNTNTCFKNQISHLPYGIVTDQRMTTDELNKKPNCRCSDPVGVDIQEEEELLVARSIVLPRRRKNARSRRWIQSRSSRHKTLFVPLLWIL